MIYVLLAVNLFFLFFNFPSTSSDYEQDIFQIENGFGTFSDYGLYETFVSKDSQGVATYQISTPVAWVKKDQNANGSYKMTDGFRVRNFYEHSLLGSKLSVTQADYLRLCAVGDWILVFKRLVYLLIGFLVLFFIRGFRKGKMFTSRMIFYVQVVGIITILFGFLAPGQKIVLHFLFRDWCDLPIDFIPNYQYIGNEPFIIIGLFIMAIAFSFGRRNYLEKQNDLTI